MYIISYKENVAGVEKMKKIIIAIFCAALMLVLPITSTAFTADMKSSSTLFSVSDETPTIFITEQQKKQLDQFVQNIDDAVEQQAVDLVNTIVIPEEDYFRIDMVALANALSLIGFHPIPENKLNIDMILELSPIITQQYLDDLLEEYWGLKDGKFINNPLGDLIQKIIEMIKGRLGWVYEFFSRGINLFIDGATLVVEFMKIQIEVAVAASAAFVLIINQILTAPETVRELIKQFFSGEFQEFLNTILDAKDEFVNNSRNLLDQFRAFIENFAMISSYIYGENGVYGFIDWIDSEPWKNPIQITGVVKKLNGEPLPDAVVTCRGVSYTTDSNGIFDFSVSSTPGEDSFPSGEWYGMHNCTIKVTYDGESLKETMPLLSYSFSDGEIKWTILTTKSRSREIRAVFSGILDNILLRIQNLFSLYLKNFNAYKI